MKDNRWTKRCTEWQPRRGKRSRGRLCRRWRDDITRKEGTTWIRKAQNGRQWKTLMEGYILQWMDKAKVKVKAKRSHTVLSRCRLVGIVVKTSSPRTAGLGSIPALALDLFPCRVIPVTENLELQWIPCQATGFILSVLRLAGQVSVYYDWSG